MEVIIKTPEEVERFLKEVNELVCDDERTTINSARGQDE